MVPKDFVLAKIEFKTLFPNDDKNRKMKFRIGNIFLFLYFIFFSFSKFKFDESCDDK